MTLKEMHSRKFKASEWSFKFMAEKDLGVANLMSLGCNFCDFIVA